MCWGCWCCRRWYVWVCGVTQHHLLRVGEAAGHQALQHCRGSSK
jgi:hypothetical protein